MKASREKRRRRYALLAGGVVAVCLIAAGSVVLYRTVSGISAIEPGTCEWVVDSDRHLLLSTVSETLGPGERRVQCGEDSLLVDVPVTELGPDPAATLRSAGWVAKPLTGTNILEAYCWPEDDRLLAYRTGEFSLSASARC